MYNSNTEKIQFKKKDPDSILYMMKIQCKTQLQYNNQVRVQDFLDRWLTSNTLTPYQTGLVPRALSLSYRKWVRVGFIQVLWFDASWFPKNLLKSARLRYLYIVR